MIRKRCYMCRSFSVVVRFLIINLIYKSEFWLILEIKIHIIVQYYFVGELQHISYHYFFKLVLYFFAFFPASGNIAVIGRNTERRRRRRRRLLCACMWRTQGYAQGYLISHICISHIDWGYTFYFSRTRLIKFLM